MTDAVETTPGMSRPVLERRCQLTPGMTTLNQRWGVLRLYEDRLEFDADTERFSFSAPLASFHSPRNWVGRGITIYRGDERLKFELSYQGPIEQFDAKVRADVPVLLAGEGGSRDRLSEQNAERAAKVWSAALAKRVTAPPPDGVRVKKTYGPEQRTLYLALVIGILCLIVVAFGSVLWAVLSILG